MPKQLNVNLAFTADTSKAAKEIQALQQQLTQLINNGMKNSSSLGLTKEIREAVSAASQLQQQLHNATTASGNLDLVQFNTSLQKSWGSLDVLNQKLSALGPAGQQAFSSLAQSIATAEIPIRKSNTLLSEMATTIANTARWQLSSSLIHGFVGGLQQAYGYAKDLNESLNNIRIVTGQSTDQMAQLAQKANQAARELSTRTTDYTNASLIYYQQGLNDKQVEERTRTTLKLANVTKQSAEEVSTQMTAIWNNFDNGTKSLEYYADAITALGAKTASSSAEIAQGLSKFAAVADTIGLSYETATAALATVVAETRQSADTVGNAFKSIFSRIQSLKMGETLEDGVGLTKYTQALETVGVQVLDINGELREADDIMSDLGERWQEISDTQKAALAQTVAGQRQYAQFIALFDNWDKVQQNIGIASDSEGTLQKQQDIYAEGWEASAKRVKAAAEQIYDALISDDFFISFNKFLEGVLNRVNDLIKGFGGLGGTLTAFGGILTNVFSSQIAKEIDRITSNIKNSSKATREQIDKLQENAQNILNINADKALQRSQGQQGLAKTQSQAYREQAALIGKLKDNYKKFNDEQLRGIQASLDQHKTLQNETIELAKQYEKQKEIADQRTRDAQQQALRAAQDQGKNDPAVLAEKVKQAAEAYRDFQVSIESVNGMENPLINITSALETNEEKVSSLTILYDSFGQSLNALASEASPVAAEAQELIDAFEALKTDNSDEAIQRVADAFQNLQTTLSGLDIDIVAEKEQILRQALEEAGVAGEQQDRVIQNLRNSYGDLAEKTADLSTQQVAVASNYKRINTELSDSEKATMSFGKQMSSFASTVMSMASVFNSVKSAVNSLVKGDIGGFVSAIPSVIMSLSMLTSAVKKFQTAETMAMLKATPLIGSIFELGEKAGLAAAGFFGLNLAELKAAGGAAALKAAFFEVIIPLAAIAAAIAAAIGLFKLLGKAIDNAFETKAEKAERLQSEVDKTSSALESCKTAAENLKSAFDGYTSAREALDNCKKGTKEWYDELNNVNTKVLELLNQYPQLAKYLTHDENGVLGFTEEGMKEVSVEQQRNVTSATAANLRANIDNQQFNLEQEKQELASKLYDVFANEGGDAVKIALQQAGVDFSEVIYGNYESVVNQIIEGGINISDALDSVGDALKGAGDPIVKTEEELETDLRNWLENNHDEVLGAMGTGKWNGFSGYQNPFTAKDANNNYVNQFYDAEGNPTKLLQGLQGYVSNNAKGWNEGLSESSSLSEILQAFGQNEPTTYADVEYPEEVRIAMAGIDAATSHYQGSVNELADTQSAYGKVLGQLAIQENENLKNNPYLDKVEGLAGRLWDQSYEKAQGNYADSSTLAKDFVQYIQDNNVAGFKDINEKNGVVTYKDDQGNDQTATKNFMINMMAASDASLDMSNKAEKVAAKFEELETSGDKVKEGFSDFLSTGEFDRNVRNLKEEYEKQLKEHGDDKNAAVEDILDQMIGDDKDGKIAEATAQQYGYKSKQALIEAFLSGLESYDEDIKNARDTGSKFLNNYYKQIIKANEEAVNDLSREDQSKIGDLLKQATDSGGYAGLQAIIDILSHTSDLSGTIAALSGDEIKWAATSVDELKTHFSDLGIVLDGVDDSQLQTIINTMKQIGEISFDSATSTFKSLHDIVDDLEKGDTIKAEDFDILQELDPEQINSFFAPMADGTYKLIGDAEEFYNFVNGQSIEAFKQGWQQEMDKVKSAQKLIKNFGEEGSGTLTYKNGKELGLFDETQTFNENGKLTGSYYEASTQAQLDYLKAIGVEDEKLQIIQADLDDNGRLIKENYDNLREILNEHTNEWHKVAEGQEEAKNNAENYVTMLESSASDLSSLAKMFSDGDFEDTGKTWSNIAHDWKEKFFNKDDIDTLEEINNGLDKIAPKGQIALSALSLDEAREKWNEIKDDFVLTKDNFDEFNEAATKGVIGVEDYTEKVGELYSTASSLDELDEIISNVNFKFIDGEKDADNFTKAVIELLGQSDQTTAETVQTLIDKLIEGKGVAKDFADAMVEAILGQTDKTAQEKKEQLANANNQIQSNETVSEETKAATNRSTGFGNIELAQSDEFFASDKIKLFKEGIEQIGDFSTLTAMEVREIGNAAKEVFSGQGSTLDAVNNVVNAFGGIDGIDPSNLKIVSDIIMDMIANADDMSLEEQFEAISTYMESMGIPVAEEYADIIKQIFEAGESSGILGNLNNLNDVMSKGLLDAQTYLSLYTDLINNNKQLTDEEKAQWYQGAQANQGNQEQATIDAQLAANGGDTESVVDFGKSINTLEPEAIQAYTDALIAMSDAANNGDQNLQNLFNTTSFVGQDIAAGIRDGSIDVIQLANEVHDVFNQDYAIPENIQQGILDACEGFEDFNKAVNEGLIDNVELANEKLDELFNDVLEDPDIDVGELKDLSKYLKNVANGTEEAKAGFEGLSKDIADNDKEAKTIASDILRYGNAVQKVNKDSEKWSKTLQKLAKNNERAFSDDDVKNVAEMGNAMADMLGLDMGTLSKDFLQNADNLELMQEAAQGSSEAYDELMQKAGEDILTQVGIDTDRFASDRDMVQSMAEDLTGQEWDDIEIGASLNDEDFLNALTEMVNAAGMTADQATSYLASMGVDAEVVEEDTEAEETHETIGWEGSTHPITGTVHMPGVSISSSDEGVAPQETAGVETDWTYDALDVTPKPEEETATKENKAFSLKVTSANKSSGGGMKHTSTGGGGGGGTSGGCFIAGTLITTNIGFKNIEDIKIGDIVLSYNEKMKRNEYSQVLQTFIHNVHENIYTLYIENEELKVTGIHRFLIKKDNKQQWIHASNLKINDQVLFADGTWHYINNITIKKQFRIVYNFEVSNNHNYYVGENQILAHNKGRGCFIAGTPVLMNGYYKNIEDVQKGDIVLSYNEKLKKNEYSEVLQTMTHIVLESIYTLHIEDEIIVTTDIHRFLITRNNKQAWIAAADLKIGDQVLFADGTLHTIHQIDTRISFRTVYNFEVSGNHNYYVGKNNVLAHNKGRGGGGGRARASARVRNSQPRVDSKERYHVVNKQLESLTKQYEDIAKSKDRAFGAQHIKNLDLEIAAQDKLIKKQQEYKKEIEDYLKLDKKALDNQKKKTKKNEYKKENGNAEYQKLIWTGKSKEKGEDGNDTEYEIQEKNAYARADIKGFLGKKYKAKYDKDGNITNIDALKAAADKKYNEEAERAEKEIKDDSEFDLTTDEGIEGYKKNIEAKNRWSMIQAQYEQLNANFDQYEETVQLRMEKIAEIIDAEIAKANLKLEKVDYKVNLHIELKDQELKIITGMLDNLSDSARNAARRIELLGQSFRLMQDQAKANRKGISEILGQHQASTAGLTKVKDNNGITQYFAKDPTKSKKQVNKAKQNLSKLEDETNERRMVLSNDQIKLDEQAKKVLNNKKGKKLKKNETRDLKQLKNEYQENLQKAKTNKEKEELKRQYESKVETTKNNYSNQREALLSTNKKYSKLKSQVDVDEKAFNKANKKLKNTKEMLRDNEMLDGSTILKSFQEQGANSKYINKLVKRKDFSEDEIKKMAEYAQNNLDTALTIKQQRLEVFENVSNVLDEWTGKFDRVIARQEHLNNMTESYRNIVDIIGRTNFYSGPDARAKGRELEQQMDETQRKQANASISTFVKEEQNVQKQLDQLQAQRDWAEKRYNAAGTAKAKEEWKESLDAYDKEINKMTDKLYEVQESKQEAFENALQKNEEIWERALERSAEEFSETMSGTALSLDYLAESMERYTKTHSTMVADYEKVHQLRQMDLEAQKAIDEANDPKIKRELLQIQEKITANSDKDTKMSQYQLTYLKQQLELKQAEAALKDAENAKTQVSLTRDSEGNYGYVYTADEGNVQDAEKNYEDKIYEMRKANAEYIQELQTNLVSIEQEAQQKIAEVMADKNLTAEERQAEANRILEDYKVLYADTGAELGFALNASKDIYGEFSNIYAEITGDLMANNVDYIGSFKETQLSMQTGFKSIDGMASTWKDSMGQYMQEVNTATSALATNNEESFKAAGETMSGYGGKTVSSMGENAKAVENLSTEMSKLGDEASTSLDKTLGATKKFEKEFTGKMATMVKSAENLLSAVTQLQEAMTGLNETAKSDGTQQAIDKQNKKKNRLYTVGRGRTSKTVKSNKAIDKLRAKHLSKTRAYKNKVRELRKQNKQARKNGGRVLSDKQIARKAASAARKALKKILKKKKWDGIIIKYNTGGYTGTWSGNEGRMAMLHQKELVLNQSDTSNILKAVDMIRDISSRIDMNALAASGAFASGISGINGVTGGVLEQEVHITAEFPNATDRNEIQEAFNNVINLAAQYANRK